MSRSIIAATMTKIRIMVHNGQSDSREMTTAFKTWCALILLLHAPIILATTHRRVQQFLMPETRYCNLAKSIAATIPPGVSDSNRHATWGHSKPFRESLYMLGAKVSGPHSRLRYLCDGPPKSGPRQHHSLHQRNNRFRPCPRCILLASVCSIPLLMELCDLPGRTMIVQRQTTRLKMWFICKKADCLQPQKHLSSPLDRISALLSSHCCANYEQLSRV